MPKYTKRKRKKSDDECKNQSARVIYLNREARLKKKLPMFILSGFKSELFIMCSSKVRA